MAKRTAKKNIATITHDEAARTNIPTAEMQPVVQPEDQKPVDVRYQRGTAALKEEKQTRNRDLDPQLVWRGKDEQDWSDLVVQAPPIYIQEKVHPKALIDDLVRQTEAAQQRDETEQAGMQLDLFADFNGLPSPEAKTEFYRHEGHWSNRMILGDSLAVMASLAEREGLRGKVQCIYFDPPYGIKFNSNFQWSTTSRDVKDGKADHITREPEQVKAFRDTWRDGIHSYLTYLRDRLIIARDLLSDSGSIFIQIGDENVHRVRSVLDEVFMDKNFISQISVKKTSGATGENLPGTTDYILFYAKNIDQVKYRQAYIGRKLGADGDTTYSFQKDLAGSRTRLTPTQIGSISTTQAANRVCRLQTMTSQSLGRSKGKGAASWFPVHIDGSSILPSMSSRWKTNEVGMNRLKISGRIEATGKSISYIRYHGDFPVFPVNDLWTDTQSGSGMDKSYIVQTSQKIVQRCLLMATDPGDLIIDPTCGSGTTAYVAEQWGRRWITIDTSRVSLALARARIMGARYPYYLLSDSPEGKQKEAKLSQNEWVQKPNYGNIRHGFVYERVPHITLKAIVNNAEIDVLYEQYQPAVLAALDELNTALKGHSTPFPINTGARQGTKVAFTKTNKQALTMPSDEAAPANALLEWEVPREAPADWPASTTNPLNAFWQARIARQKAIDASIAAKADYEYLYDKPYKDTKTCRVSGPFTVESLSPHRTLGIDHNDELIDPLKTTDRGRSAQQFDQMILENLSQAGVQQAHKADKIEFTHLAGWPGTYVCAEGRYQEGKHERRAGIFIGPEFGTVSREDLVRAARETADAGFDVLVACAFSYEAHASEFDRLGRIPVLRARMNADLHMADNLKNTGKGNLFVIFGEPDIDLIHTSDGKLQVKVNGVDVFDPSTGEVRSDSADGIACWFIDTDYNSESFFVRHAYFLGQGKTNDPYKSLKTTLKAEIDREAWESLYSDTSRPFSKPNSGFIAVKIINHLGDEVMKVFEVV